MVLWDLAGGLVDTEASIHEVELVETEPSAPVVHNTPCALDVRRKSQS
jgi:hypothetical protein